MSGLFAELGPSSFPNEDRKMVRNKYAWNNNASVIFLDQPVGTGFSYTDKQQTSTSLAAAKDVYSLLTLFFQQFPQYAKQDFHIAGESYAGHYIPSTGAEIFSHSSRNINLKSLLIGNGLTDELSQYPYYGPMACGKGGWPAARPKSDCDKLDREMPACLKEIQACYDSSNVSTCSHAEDTCNTLILNFYRPSDRSDYDVREHPPIVYDYSQDFLTSNKTRKAIGAETSFTDCSGSVHSAFSKAGDWMLPIHRKVPGLLAKIPVLVYAGDADWICNWLGNQAWTNNLEWPGKAAFNSAATKPATLPNGKEYGTIKHANGLAFMRVYAASHFVPSDQPEGSLNMFNRWIGGEWQK